VQGNPPYGYMLNANDRLILGHPDEIKIIRRIFREYLKSGSLRSITAGLNADGGVLPPGGSSWCRSTVRNILTRRLYVGDFVWNVDPHGKYCQVRGGQVQRVNGDIGIPISDADEIFIRGNNDPIIKRDKFDAVQQRISQRRVNRHQRTRDSRATDRYASTGLLWCGECGRAMHGKTEGGRATYVCAGASEGGHRNPVRQDRLMAEMFGAIHTHLADPERLERFKQAVRRRENQCDNITLKSTISRVENRIAAINQKLEKATPADAGR